MRETVMVAQHHGSPSQGGQASHGAEEGVAPSMFITVSLRFGGRDFRAVAAWGDISPIVATPVNDRAKKTDRSARRPARSGSSSVLPATRTHLASGVRRCPSWLERLTGP